MTLVVMHTCSHRHGSMPTDKKLDSALSAALPDYAPQQDRLYRPATDERMRHDIS